MTVQINAYDPDNNGIGIYFDQYLNQKFAAFDGVAGVLSADTNATGMLLSVRMVAVSSSIPIQAGRSILLLAK